MRWITGEKAIPLRSLTVKRGHWSHTWLLSQIQTCKEWGRRPSEFGICAPEEDLTYMMARDYVIGRMEAHERAEQERLQNQQKADKPKLRAKRR